MGGTPWGRELAKLEGTEPTLEEMEDALDRQYYSHALKVSKGRDSNIHLMKAYQNRNESSKYNKINSVNFVRTFLQTNVYRW